MTKRDLVLERLAELPVSAPSRELSRRIQQLGHQRLRARKVHPFWALTVVASVVVYLGWAMYVSRDLF